MSDRQASEREAIAEALWQAESVRASGARRRSAWRDEGPDVHLKWLFMADAALAAQEAFRGK